LSDFRAGTAAAQAGRDALLAARPRAILAAPGSSVVTIAG
jgi:hypothetical protein